MLDALRDLWTALLAVPHLKLYLALGWAVYLLWLGSWIVLQKREPVATLSWLISLALLPYVGFLIYYLFGPQRSSASACAAPARARGCRRLPEGFKPTCRGDRAGAPGARPRPACRRPPRPRCGCWSMAAPSTTRCWPTSPRRRNTSTSSTTSSIPTAPAPRLRDALVERARAGVKVRLLLDAVGSAKTPARFFDALRRGRRRSSRGSTRCGSAAHLASGRGSTCAAIARSW